jgi:hypothetical protein
MAQLTSRAFHTGQLKFLTNFTNVPFMTQKLLFGVLFSPEVSQDLTSSRIKTDKPSVISQSYTGIINEFLAPKLPPNHKLWFQQYGVTAYTAVMSMAALRTVLRSG